MSSAPDLNTREGRLQALHSTGVLTSEEYTFALREGLDITDNIPALWREATGRSALTKALI